MKNFIIVCLVFAALFALVPVVEAGCCFNQSGFFVQSSGLGFVPSGFGTHSVFIQQAPPVFINQGGGNFEQRSFRGPFGATRTVIRRF